MPDATAAKTNDLLALRGMSRLVVRQARAPASKLTYGIEMRVFFAWWESAIPGHAFDADLVDLYLSSRKTAKRSPNTLSLELSVLRKLAGKAADEGIIDANIARDIAKLKACPPECRLGTHLSKEQANMLMRLPDDNLRGTRDRAILAVFLGCGLHREEVSRLCVEQLAVRAGTWVIRLSSRSHPVPLPAWTLAAISTWKNRAEAVTGVPFTGRLFRCIHATGAIGKPISPKGIGGIVSEYGNQLGLSIGPHELRRTYAQLAYEGGVPLEQLYLSLGVKSLAWTIDLLLFEQKLSVVPGDYLGIEGARRTSDM